MKKFLHTSCSLLLLGAILLLNSCSDPLADEGTIFTEDQLVGTWQSATLYEKYSNDHKGTTWDTADDVTEEEAQSFTWSLDANNLVQIHIMEVGGNIPRSYTVKELTGTTLVYEDSYGKQTTFARVK